MNACTCCTSDHLTEIDAALRVGATLETVAGLFDVSKDSASRHRRDHLAPAASTPVGVGVHLASADDMIAQSRAARTFDSYDDAEAVYLRSIAAALDARSDNPSLLHEFRVTIASFRPPKVEVTPLADRDVALAQLIADLSMPDGAPEVYERTYAAVIASGGTEDAAFAAANAAIGEPDRVLWDGYANGVRVDR